jgi:regulator of replication initiation timing
MTTVKLGHAIDTEPLERLEEKVRKLVTLIEQLRGDKAQLVDENTRLQVQLESQQGKVEALQAKLAEADQASSELTALREERDQVRTRVADLLEQIEALEI